MNTRYFLAILVCAIAGSVRAQDILKGTVYDNSTDTRLENVFVHDNASKELTLTDKHGDFEIKTEQGHLLIFECPGYVSDTLYLVDMKPKKIMLESARINLREVNINATKQAFNPQKEYPEVYEKSKVYILSPSSWFSKESRDARRLKRYFKREKEERYIDGIFTKAYVSSLVPLKGQQLEDFMTLYRPSYSFLMDNNGPSLAVYINDCYKKYKALPPDKRTVQKLVDTTAVKQ